MCGVFYGQHVKNCKYCENVFVNNDGLQACEKICGEHVPLHSSVQVHTQFYAFKTFNVLSGSSLQIPTSPTPVDIVRLKVSTLGYISGDSLMRAILPYADLDYALLHLPQPIQQDAGLDENSRENYWDQKRLCRLCHEWYI